MAEAGPQELDLSKSRRPIPLEEGRELSRNMAGQVEKAEAEGQNASGRVAF